MNEFRLLKANEIECRVGQCGKTNNGGWCSLLLYKDARCDQRLLDEKFGIFGWKRKHEVVNNQLCCTVAIRDPETKEWIEKQDVGVESNTEAVKGSFSDAFKRACFNWGLGRELYTAPKIFINLNSAEIIDKNGRPAVAAKCVFTVTEIGYDNERNINALTIVDKNNNVRFKMGQKTQNAPAENSDINDQLNGYALPSIQQARTRDELERIWNDFPQLQDDQRFISAINNKLNEVKAVA